jgi:RimJ/RimL family protein N-acetyltransferase
MRNLYAEIHPIPERIEAERVYLRAVQMGDGSLVRAGVEETFEQLHQWMPWAKHMPSMAESETFARESAAKFRTKEEFDFLLFHKSDDRYLGNLGIHTIDWDVPRFELGYWLRISEQGNGYVTEAVGAICDLLFDELKAERIEIRCDNRNLNSAAVAERAGFTLEAVLRNNSRDNEGGLRSTRVYVLFPASEAP